MIGVSFQIPDRFSLAYRHPSPRASCCFETCRKWRNHFPTLIIIIIIIVEFGFIFKQHVLPFEAQILSNFSSNMSFEVNSWLRARELDMQMRERGRIVFLRVYVYHSSVRMSIHSINFNYVITLSENEVLFLKTSFSNLSTHATMADGQWWTRITTITRRQLIGCRRSMINSRVNDNCKERFKSN